MSSGMKVLRLLRRIAFVALLGLCSLWSLAGPTPKSEPEGGTRRIWNKRFQEARARTLARRRGRPLYAGRSESFP